MSPTSIILLLAILLLIVFLRSLCSILLPQKLRKIARKLAPGPWPLPIIGNFHMLSALPHRNLQNMAKKYGPIMSIKLGHVPTVIVSSPKAAELFLKTKDAVFASRPKVQASKYMSYGTKGMAFTEYGPYWRNLRKLCTSQLLSASKIESFAALRREAIRLLVESLRKSSAVSEIVDLSQKLGEISADISCGMILGRNKGQSYRLKELVHEALCLMGTFNIADYVPFLEPFDLQGLRRSMKNVSKEIDEVYERIIMEHERVESVQQVPYKDFVDILLSLIDQPMNPQDQHVYFIDRTTIKAILVDLTVASFDTSATSIEWALSELLRNPRVMKKLQNELETSIGMDQLVEEKDLGKLQYLDMVVKESFRLHPVAPFLIPRESMEDVTIDGYHIPKKSRVLVNTWSIGRDPNIWSENAEDFYPERFIGTNIGVRGQDFQLLPFGSGRRGCPGMQLGLTTIHFVLAQLVHCFNWEIPIGMEDKDIDMNEKLFGLSMGRANHLLAKPSFRLLCEPTDDIFNVFSKK